MCLHNIESKLVYQNLTNIVVNLVFEDNKNYYLERLK